MKKIMFAALAAVLFAACAKDDTQKFTTIPDPAGEGIPVTISFGDEGVATRAFFDDAATAEPWEMELKTLSIYVYGSGSPFVLRRNLTAAELAAKTATVTLPPHMYLTSCTFVAVANAEAGHFDTREEMYDCLTSISALEYNSADDANFSRCVRAGGFEMVAKEIVYISDVKPITLSLALKRNVAKIAVRTTVHPDFAANYNGGTVVIEQAEILNANATSYLVPPRFFTPAENATFSHTQTSQVSDGYNNLFYVYACHGKTVEENDLNVKLKLRGYFDADGNPATTADRSAVEYTVRVKGAGTGTIFNNGYYRIEASVKGLSGDGLVVTFTAADWETPATANVDLGV